MWSEAYASVIFLLVVRLNSVHTLKCYSCLSDHKYGDCARPKVDQISLVKCDMMALEQTRDYAKRIGGDSHSRLFQVDSTETELGRIGMACLKMITKVGNKDYWLRGCQLAEQGNLDICDKIQKSNSGLVHCSKCTSEGCNSSTKYGSNIIVALLGVIIPRVLYKIFQFHI